MAIYCNRIFVYFMIAVAYKLNSQQEELKVNLGISKMLSNSTLEIIHFNTVFQPVFCYCSGIWVKTGMYVLISLLCRNFICHIKKKIRGIYFLSSSNNCFWWRLIQMLEYTSRKGEAKPDSELWI